VLGQHNFSNQIQIDVLKVIDFALYQKQYPENIHGIIKRKMKLLEQNDREAVPAESNLQLSTKRGFKLNFIRVFNVLFELKFFTDKQGGYNSKKEVFENIGSTVNQDLSDFQNNMNVSFQTANADMESMLVIFKEMLEKQIEINNSKTEKKYRK
jgi:hypothetical protein